jgi:hypothetical protein
MYAFKNWEEDIYYYRPVRMLFMSIHTKICDCNMCEQVNSPQEEPIQVSVPQVIPQVGRCTPGNRQRPRANHQPPPYSPAHSSVNINDWIIVRPQEEEPKLAPSAPPAAEEEDTNSLDGWNNPTTDWSEPLQTNLEPLQTNLEPLQTNLHQPHPQHSHLQLRREYEEHLKWFNQQSISREICHGIPPTPSTWKKINKAIIKVRKARDLIERALKGEVNYESAYYEWILYTQHCRHQCPIYSASHIDDCFSCWHHATTLKDLHKEHHPETI